MRSDEIMMGVTLNLTNWLTNACLKVYDTPSDFQITSHRPFVSEQSILFEYLWLKFEVMK